MDIIMAIQHLIESTEINIRFQHVKAHADDDKPFHECNRIEQYNIKCNADAEKCVQQNHKPTPFQPLPGSKCMIQLQGKWLFQCIDKSIQYITTTKESMTYLEN